MSVAEAVVRLLPGRQRGLRHGRRWVYRTEVAGVEGQFAPGDVVGVVDHRGRFVARGFCNPASMLFVRVLTESPEERLDAAFFRRRLDAAWAYRRRVLADADLNCCRVVFSESDLLPGLVVDRFGPVVVLQALSLGMERLKADVVADLVDLLAPEAVYERDDAPVRALEGLAEARGTLWGQLPAEVWVREGGVDLRVDVEAGQKTGHFLDQRFNRLALGAALRARSGAEVLDAFCHTGGFGLQALAAGAASAVFLDVSSEAVTASLANAARNGWGQRAEGVTANAFDQLRQWRRDGRQFDVIVLDPPAFAKNRQALDGAYRGYKEINLSALRLLRRDGLLVTSSCSQPVSGDMFLQMLADAAGDAGRAVRVIERRGPAPDHPGLLGADETVYLKCVFLEVA
jgi:23S rRNA (cytosine1962-C5)-methyltransferase